MNNFQAKVHKILSKVLPIGFLTQLENLFYYLKKRPRNSYLRNQDKTKGFFEINLPYLSETVEFYLNLKNQTEYELLSQGPPEPEYSVILERLSPGDVFYDIGSYIGSFTLPAALATQPQGVVVAIEPNESSLDRLKKSLQHNNLRNVITFNYAMGAENTTGYLYSSSNPSTDSTASAQNSSFFLGAHRQTGECTRITIKSLDKLVDSEGLPLPDFIKVDVEGAEVGVLKGMQETLANSYSRILLAVHEQKLPAFGDSTSELYRVIKDLSLNPYYIEKDASIKPLESPPFESLYDLLLIPD